jgi:hypothetical protein
MTFLFNHLPKGGFIMCTAHPQPPGVIAAKHTSISCFALGRSILFWQFLSFFLFFSTLVPSLALSTSISLPRDAAGWTVFTPSADTRIMYVAEDGNDSTAIVYTQANHPSWSTPFNPGTIKAFATHAAAYKQTREKSPDWILYKRGQSFYGAPGFNVRGGRSATEPSLLGSYGTSGLSPIVKCGNSGALRRHDQSWIAISGIDFYAQYRDPNSPEFIDHSISGEQGGAAFYWYCDYTNGMKGILIEGCKFRHFTGASYSCEAAQCPGMEIYRTVIYDNHSGTGTGHSAGMGGNYTQIIAKENILDHNGWLTQAGSGGGATDATVFNHNMYFSNLHNSVFENNISMRSSSIGLKVTGSKGAASIDGLMIANNLFFDNEVGIDIDNNYTDVFRVKGVTIDNNVLLNAGASRPTNRNLGWGINANGWDTCQVSNNIIAHNTNPLVTNGESLSFAKLMRNVSITNNVLYGLKYTEGLMIQGTGMGDSTGMSFTGNKIQIPQNSYYTVRSSTLTPGWTFANNTYYSNKTASQQFLHNNVNKSLSEWQALTGDNSTFEQVTFPDPTRSIVTYMASIGETATVEAFVAKCRAMDRYNWDTRFTAAAVNKWIKGGFNNEETKTVIPPAGVQANIIK